MIKICKGCGRLIDWIPTRANGGRKMPVDLDVIPFVEDENGKDVFVTKNGFVVRGRRAEAQELPTMYGYISHFATCPKADAFRKREARPKKDTKNGQEMSMMF